MGVGALNSPTLMDIMWSNGSGFSAYTPIKSCRRRPALKKTPTESSNHNLQTTGVYTHGPAVYKHGPVFINTAVRVVLFFCLYLRKLLPAKNNAFTAFVVFFSFFIKACISEISKAADDDPPGRRPPGNLQTTIFKPPVFINTAPLFINTGRCF